jgi:hypothetical protein
MLLPAAAASVAVASAAAAVGWVQLPRGLSAAPAGVQGRGQAETCHAQGQPCGDGR